MFKNIRIPEPSQWSTSFAEQSSLLDDGSPVNVTLRLYGPLISDEDWTRVDELDSSRHFDPKYHSEKVQPLIDQWVQEIRGTDLQPLQQGGETQPDIMQQPKPILRFTLDVSQPPDIDGSTCQLLLQNETRTTARLSALLNKIFRPLGRPLEICFEGVDCWCALRRKENNVSMPLGRSYPLQRASHMQEEMEYVRANWLNEDKYHFAGYTLEERKKLKPNIDTLKDHFNDEARKCLRLAKEHWDDEHWSLGTDEDPVPG